MPKDNDIKYARRFLLKLTADFTIEFVWIMSKCAACTKTCIKELISTPSMKARRSQKWLPLQENLAARHVEGSRSDVRLRLVNSRVKDFYDIWLLSQQFDFDGSVLSNAVTWTFAHRKTQVLATPTALENTRMMPFSDRLLTMGEEGIVSTTPGLCPQLHRVDRLLEVSKTKRLASIGKPFQRRGRDSKLATMHWTCIAPTPLLHRKGWKNRSFRDIQASSALYS